MRIKVEEMIILDTHKIKCSTASSTYLLNLLVKSFQEMLKTKHANRIFERHEFSDGVEVKWIMLI